VITLNGGIEVLAFIEPFVWFDYGVISKVDDGLIISLAITCDTHCSAAV